MTETADSGCRQLLTHISEYLDGELDAVECGTIERHCAGCPHCADVVEGLRRTIALCRETGSAPLPRMVRERARLRVRQLLAGEDADATRRG
jgi:anti-sigma factor (TIGR02949 family)